MIYERMSKSVALSQALKTLRALRKAMEHDPDGLLGYEKALEHFSACIEVADVQLGHKRISSSPEEIEEIRQAGRKALAKHLFALIVEGCLSDVQVTLFAKKVEAYRIAGGYTYEECDIDPEQFTFYTGCSTA